MNKMYKIVCLFAVMAVCALPLKTTAQNEGDIAKFLAAGGADASILMEAYSKPFVTSLSYGMTGGWFTTAKPHKTLGFDLGVTVSAAYMPTSDNYFNPATLGLSSNVSFANATNPSKGAPTIFGPRDETTYTFSGDLDGDGVADDLATISGPEGFNLKDELTVAAVPVPVIQLGIGIIKNTDLKFRYVPKIKQGGSEFSMFGVGVMHDVKQHIPGIKMLPFDLSLLVAYNSVKGSSDLTGSGSTTVQSDNGKGEYKLNSWVFQALISKKISVLTFYGGVGYNMVKTDIDVLGDYTINAAPASFTLNDPVSIDFKNNSMRLTAGMRLKLGPIYFSGDYTVQKYNMLTVGFGVAVR
jgi:hypothetical protein